jgi:hypothetical protein
LVCNRVCKLSKASALAVVRDNIDNIMHKRHDHLLFGNIGFIMVGF